MTEEKIRELGLELPSPPTPVGSYVPVVISGDLAFVSGQIPVEPHTNPPQVKFKGKVGKEISIEQAQQAAKLCTLNALAQLKLTLGNLEKIKRIVKITGFVNCEPSFTQHPQVINGASDLLVQIFGEEGKHTRAAVGTNSLPLDSAVEIEFIVQLNKQ